MTEDDRDQVANLTEDGAEPLPGIEGNRSSYDILSSDMEAVDCAIFNGRTIHGGSGNLAEHRDLKVLNTQWLGDDVRVCFRENGMDPDHFGIVTAVGLKPGAK